jgi:hypothetical protein
VAGGSPGSEEQAAPVESQNHETEQNPDAESGQPAWLTAFEGKQRSLILGMLFSNAVAILMLLFAFARMRKKSVSVREVDPFEVASDHAPPSADEFLALTRRLGARLESIQGNLVRIRREQQPLPLSGRIQPPPTEVEELPFPESAPYIEKARPGVTTGGSGYGSIPVHIANLPQRSMQPAQDPEVLVAAAAGFPEPREEAFAPLEPPFSRIFDPVADYNRCLQMDLSQAEEFFLGRYPELKGISCVNLEQHRDPGAILSFREDPRGNFMLLQHLQQLLLFPSIQLVPRESRPLLEGVFQFPAGQERLKLAAAALLKKQADALVIDKRGVFDRV